MSKRTHWHTDSFKRRASEISISPIDGIQSPHVQGAIEEIAEHSGFNPDAETQTGAQAKADQAEQNAIAAAAVDATTKANAAEQAAKDYADEAIETYVNNKISVVAEGTITPTSTRTTIPLPKGHHVFAFHVIGLQEEPGADIVHGGRKQQGDPLNHAYIFTNYVSGERRNSLVIEIASGDVGSLDYYYKVVKLG